MVGCRTFPLRLERSGEDVEPTRLQAPTNRATCPCETRGPSLRSENDPGGITADRGRHGREGHHMATDSSGEVDWAANAIPRRRRTVIPPIPVKLTFIDGSRDGAGPMRFLAWRSRSSSNPSTDRPTGEHHPAEPHHAIRSSPTIKRRTGPTATKLWPIQEDIHFATPRRMSRPSELNLPADGPQDRRERVTPDLEPVERDLGPI